MPDKLLVICYCGCNEVERFRNDNSLTGHDIRGKKTYQVLLTLIQKSNISSIGKHAYFLIKNH